MLGTLFLIFCPKKKSVELFGSSIIWFSPQHYPPGGFATWVRCWFQGSSKHDWYKKNGRLDINNAIKCDILSKVENALSEKKDSKH